MFVFGVAEVFVFFFIFFSSLSLSLFPKGRELSSSLSLDAPPLNLNHDLSGGRRRRRRRLHLGEAVLPPREDRERGELACRSGGSVSRRNTIDDDGRPALAGPLPAR